MARSQSQCPSYFEKIVETFFFLFLFFVEILNNILRKKESLEVARNLGVGDGPLPPRRLARLGCLLEDARVDLATAHTLAAMSKIEQN